jgi:hypothetical protein
MPGMKKKAELLKEIVLMIAKPKIQKWYAENLEKYPQAETINALEKGLINNELTYREALSLAILTGVQWNEKFEGTP